MSASVPPESRSSAKTLLAVETSLRAQSILLAFARFAKSALAVAVPIVLVRVLDQSTYGYYKQVGLLAATALSLLTLGIPGTLHYFVPRAQSASQSLLGRSALLLAVLGVTGGAAVVVAAPWLESFFSAPLGSYRILLGLIVAVSLPASLVEVVGVVDRRARISAIAITGLEALRNMLVVVAAVVTRDLRVVLAALAAGLGFQAIAVAAYLLWRRSQSPAERRKFRVSEQFRYALPFFGAALIGMVRDQLHSYFVAIGYTAVEFAMYAVGTLSVPFLGKLTQSVAEVVIVDASRNLSEGRLDEVRRVWWRATAGIALILLPVFVMLEVFADDIIRFVYTADYSAAAPIFRIYACLIPLGIPLSSAMLRASASLRTMAVADAMSLLGTIGALLLFAKTLGPIAAVLSLVIGNIVFNGVAGWRTACKLGIGAAEFMKWQHLAGILVVSAVAAGAAYALTRSFPLPARATAGPAIGMVLCGAGLWITRLVPETERLLAARICASTGSTIRRIVQRGARSR
jgi:O-antigen/teichoic acid export membrane protein